MTSPLFMTPYKNVVAQQLHAIVVLNVPEGNSNGIFIKLFPKSQINLSIVSIK